MRRIGLALLCSTTFLTAGCYTVNLHPIPPVAGSELRLTAQLEFPPETAGYTHVVRSAAAGIGNRFTILVGETLVQYGGAYLRPVFPEGNDATIRIEIESFDVRSFEARIRARFTVTQDGGETFAKSYDAAGKGHFAQTVWGGAFAMKSSMRKTTDEALRSLYEQFLADVRPRYGHRAAPRLDLPRVSNVPADSRG